MKAAENKTTTASLQKKGQPFFERGGGQGFFSDRAMDTSFFRKNQNTRPLIQPKLTIGQPNDKYEKEADAVADKVVQRLAMPDVLTKKETGVQTKTLASGITPLIQRKCATCENEEELQTKKDEPELQRKPIFETKKESALQMKCAECENEEEIQKKEVEEEEKEIQEKAEPLNDIQLKPIFEGGGEPIVQKKSNVGVEPDGAKKTEAPPSATKTGIPVSNDARVIQTKCAACEQEYKLQKKEDDKEDNDVLSVQTKSRDIPHPNKASASVETGINSTKGLGSAMPKDVRSQMESSFGADFSDVRIHNDSHAVQLNKELNSQAFAHGRDIYFNSGKYDATSLGGKHLLAHELTHTIQQGASGVRTKRNEIEHVAFPHDSTLKPQTHQEVQKKPSSTINNISAPNIQCVAPLVIIGGRIVAQYLIGKAVRWGIRKLFEDDRSITEILEDVWKRLRAIPVDIKGMSNFLPNPILKDYIQSFHYITNYLTENNYSADFIDLFAKGPKINFKYGSMGSVNGVRVKWNESTDTYNAGPFQMSLVHSDFDFFAKREKTLGMNVKITDSVIKGEVGVAPLGEFFQHLANSTLHDAPSDFVFKDGLIQEALLDADSENATSVVTSGTLSGGFIDLIYAGWVDIGNFQTIIASYRLLDSQDKSEWSASSDLDVMGMQPFKLNILRSAKGILSGMMAEGEKILFAGSVEAKGFKADTEIKASYLNQTLMIQGTGSFESKRAKGSIFFIVTDYATAKNHALNFLTDLEASGPVEEGPPNPTERLAFMASGNLTIILFDGKTKNRAKAAAKKLEGLALGTPSPGKTEIPPLQADAAFVVEPEGYITVSGQVRPVQQSFDLTNKQEYTKTVDLGPPLPLGTLPLPYGLGVSFEFQAKAFASAFLDPIKLSDIFVEGVYSTNPRFPTELSMGAKLNVQAGVKVGVKFCLTISVDAVGGLISITLIEKCIEGAIGMTGGIQAEPTIQIKKAPPADKDKAPPEYFIKGDLHLSAGGALKAKLGDTLAIKVKDIEDEEHKGAKPLKTWHYKNNERTKEKTLGDRTVVAPMDLTLGSGEPPDVTVPEFSRDGSWNLLNAILGREKRLNNYFEEKESIDPDPTKPKGPDQPDDTKFKSGGFEEGREERGELIKDPEKVEDEETTYTFEEAFKMLDTLHKLVLYVTQTKKGGQVQATSKLIMESETEPLVEKIEEEKKEISNSVAVDKTIREQDLAVIEKQTAQVIEDANQLGVDEELSNETRIAGLKEDALSISKYADRHNESDLGTTESIPEPKCKEGPTLNPEDDLFFPKRKDKNKLGKFIENKKNPILDRNGQTIGQEWFIVFKPKGKPNIPSAMNPAYDQNCNPLFIKREPEGCNNVNIVTPETINVPARTFNGKTYPGGKKAHKVKIYPLCWGAEQTPDSKVIGWVRIDKNYRQKWHRTHLIHGKMGGPGSSWNLVPAPQKVNNGQMKAVENILMGLVINGLHNGEYYWFSAEVFYHDNSANHVIDHFDDFVKKIEVQYGKATKDSDGKWHLEEDQDVVKVIVEKGFVGEPDSEEVALDRRRG